MGIKQRRIRVLCAEGRILGAYKVGTYWLIPSDADKPKDERIKSGKYKKTTSYVKDFSICTISEIDKLYGIVI